MTPAHYVLVVDDDRDIRESLAELLVEDGHQVRVAANGQEALDLLRASERPCLILLDVMMPVMDGRRFLEEKGRDTALVEIPVCLVTAGASIPSGPGVVSVVKKPIDFAKLRGLVERYC